MLVKNRYGGVQDMPERVARALIKAGTVAAFEAKKPEPKKPRKAAKSEQEAE